MKAPRIGSLRENVCADCGEKFLARTHKAERCPICRNKRNVDMARENQRKHRREKQERQNAQRAAAREDKPAKTARWKDGRAKYRLIFDPSGDYTLGAHFDLTALPGMISTNYDAWDVGTRWTDGRSIFEYRQKGKKIERVTA